MAFRWKCKVLKGRKTSARARMCVATDVWSLDGRTALV